MADPTLIEERVDLPQDDPRLPCRHHSPGCGCACSLATTYSVHERLPRNFQIWGILIVSRSCRTLVAAEPLNLRDSREGSTASPGNNDLTLLPRSTISYPFCSSGSVPENRHHVTFREVQRRVRMSAQWPKAVRAFSVDLPRIAPQLRTHGISEEFARTNASRFIKISAERASPHLCVTSVSPLCHLTTRFWIESYCDSSKVRLFLRDPLSPGAARGWRK